MSRVKRQHTVPCAYLRRFANARDQIHVYDKQEMRSFVSNIRKVAAEHAFLDVPQLEDFGISEQFMETEYLAAFEREGAIALEALISSVESGNFREIRGKRRAQLARFIAIQSLRTREHREELAEFVALLQEAQFRAQLETLSPEQANEPFRMRLHPEAERVNHVRDLLDPEHLAAIVRLLLLHTWHLFQGRAGRSFWTSDNPVVRHPRVTNSARGGRGFGSTGVEITYPITPSLAVSVAETSHFAPIMFTRGQLWPLDDEGVAYCNRMQVIYSSRFVFSASPDFDLAESMCRAQPRLRDPNRRRIFASGGPWTNLGGGVQEQPD